MFTGGSCDFKRLALSRRCFSSSRYARRLPRSIRSCNFRPPFVVEYYYKTKWGHADEFLKLFKKNHYPVLKKEDGDGPDRESLDGSAALSHHRRRALGFRVTIVFKNATVANEPFDEAALQKQMYPDQETFQREEQRRFEILDGHWDLPVKTVDLDGKPKTSNTRGIEAHRVDPRRQQYVFTLHRCCTVAKDVKGQ